MTDPTPLDLRVRFHHGTVELDSTGDHPVGARVEALDPTDARSVEVAARARIDNDGRRLTVDVPGRTTRKDSTRVKITVSLPPYSSVVSESGDLTLTSVGALQDLRIRTGSGEIRVPTARGAVDVRAGDALLVVGSANGVSLVSGRGHLRVTDATDVNLKVGHGEAELQRTSGRVTVKGGGVALALHEAAGGEVSFDSGAGSARVGVVAGTSVQVDLSSGMGTVRCDVPLEGTAPSGGADLRVRLRTGSGDVVVAPA